MKDLDKQLFDTKMAVLRRKQLLARMDSLLDQRDALQNKEHQLSEQLYKEEADVENLEGGSLLKYVYYIAGNYDEKLDKEKREAYEASVRYDAVCKELDVVLADLDKTDAELDSLIDCEEQYAALLQEKRNRIKAADPARGEAIVKLEEKIQELQGQQKELEEAVAAGERALRAASSVAAELKSASDWGLWDMLGGGILVDMAKHSHLDNAQARVETLQVQLRSFRTELADVSIDTNVQIQLDSFLSFADYFFDGIFADWAVMDHIERSQNQINNVLRQIHQVLDALDSMLRDNEQTQTELQQERDSMIVQY